MAPSLRCDVVDSQDKSQEIKNKNMGAEYQFFFPVNLIDMIEPCMDYENIKVALAFAIKFRHILNYFFGWVINGARRYIGSGGTDLSSLISSSESFAAI